MPSRSRVHEPRVAHAYRRRPSADGGTLARSQSNTATCRGAGRRVDHVEERVRQYARPRPRPPGRRRHRRRPRGRPRGARRARRGTSPRSPAAAPGSASRNQPGRGSPAGGPSGTLRPSTHSITKHGRPTARVPSSIATTAGTGTPSRPRAATTRASRHGSSRYTTLGSARRLEHHPSHLAGTVTSRRDAPLAWPPRTRADHDVRHRTRQRVARASPGAHRDPAGPDRPPHEERKTSKCFRASRLSPVKCQTYHRPWCGPCCRLCEVGRGSRGHGRRRPPHDACGPTTTIRSPRGSPAARACAPPTCTTTPIGCCTRNGATATPSSPSPGTTPSWRSPHAPGRSSPSTAPTQSASTSATPPRSTRWAAPAP